MAKKGKNTLAKEGLLKTLYDKASKHDDLTNAK